MYYQSYSRFIVIILLSSSLLLVCRMEETLLGVYGADGWRGAAKERIKLQSELDRARDQVLPSSIPTPPPLVLARCSNPVVLSILFCAALQGC